MKAIPAAWTITDAGYSPVEIMAAKMKIEEARALSRCVAVQYLATVDCHYYPEAELCLIAALRADWAICVRQEAACAIGNCRSPTPRMLEALQMTAQGSDKDGHPAETSLLVREAAHAALAREAARGVLRRFRARILDRPISGPPQTLPPEASKLSNPRLFQPTGAFIPVSSVASSSALQQERELAQSVSSGAKVAPAPRPVRSFYEFLLNLIFARGSAPSDQAARK